MYTGLNYGDVGMTRNHKLKMEKRNKLKSKRKISQKKKLKFKLLFQSFHAKRLKGSEC